ncbi:MULTISPECIES: dihydrofolate reductase [Roseateles]|uniref:dihydrofolate reductase n=1 Tax=Roseateles TaxID=93681 RepID=UPI0014952432|nr:MULTISPECIES: dihydrofolate reductase [Roseateles]WIW00058.1 dihydrofolate reductase [Paucibacter aquatile]
MSEQRTPAISTRPRVVLVAALGRGREIGRDNGLLWHLPEDMAHFKALTQGQPVLMGRKTWDSLPERFRPLPGRRNMVLSRQPGLMLAGAEVFADVPSALRACDGLPQVCVIGGAQIYAEALAHADVLELTEVAADFADADSWFPAWPATEFAETGRQTLHSEKNGWRFDFVRYERRAQP